MKTWSIALCCVLGAATVEAQDRELEQITVTARRRAEDAQKIPVSIAVLDGNELLEHAFYDADQFDDYIPNLLIAKGPLNTNITIRGIQSGANDGFEQSVALGFNGVYNNRGRLLRTPIFDLERVEVLRGPQSVLFGKNTIAGVINMVTARPTDERDAYVSTWYESEIDSWAITAAASGPLTDRWNGRVALRGGGADGVVFNSATNSTVPQNDDWGWRGSLSYEGSGGTNASIILELTRFSVDGSRYQIVDAGPYLPAYQLFDPEADGTLDRRSSVGGLPDADVERTRAAIASFELTHSFERIDLTALTGYTAFDLYRFVDTDFSAMPLLGTLTPRKRFVQISQDLRVDFDVGDRFGITVGAGIVSATLDVARRQDADGDVLALLAAGTPVEPLAPFITSSPVSHFDQTADATSVFAETEWRPSDRASLRFGARWTDETKAVVQSVQISAFRTQDGPITDPTALAVIRALFGYENHTLQGRRDESDTTASVSFSYALGENRTLYASFASGFKSGGFNEEQRTANFSEFEFDSERAASKEIGGKFEIGRGAARLNVALFTSKFHDLQTSTFDGVVWIVSNAAAASSDGVELDGLWRVTPNLTIGGALAHLDSRFIEHLFAPCMAGQPPGCFQDLSGKTTNFAPERTANLFLDFVRHMRADLMMAIRLDANYTDGFYFNGDLDPKDYQHAHTTVDGRIAVSRGDGRWEVALIGRNMTDKRFPLYRIDAPLLPGAYFGEPNDPRTWALQFTKRF